MKAERVSVRAVRFAARAARAARAVRRHASGTPGAFVLLYHRVADPNAEPWGDPWGLCVTPERFAQQLAALRAHAHPMPLADFAAARRAGALPPGAVAVTFDDGYLDNLAAARPLLARHGVPATVFLATGYAGHGRRFWWDVLARHLLGPHPLPARLDLEGRLPDGAPATFARLLTAAERAPRRSDADRGWIAMRDAADARQALYFALWRWAQTLDPATRDAAIATLADAVPLPADVPPAPRALTAAEVAVLVDGGLVEVGAHSVSHPMLPNLPPDRQREEVVRSRDDTARLAGSSVATFSYPHGSYDATTVALVRDAGFTAATTVGVPGEGYDCATPRGDPLHLPRVTVGDWTGRAFRWRLRAGFEF